MGHQGRPAPPRPIEVFMEGHVAPEDAIVTAATRGLDSEGYVTVQYQVVDLPKWVKPKWNCLKRIN